MLITKAKVEGAWCDGEKDRCDQDMNNHMHQPYLALMDEQGKHRTSVLEIVLGVI